MTGTGTDTDLLARLQRVEDLVAINQLFIDYGRYLDACDFDSYSSLFARDGEVLLGPVGRAKGPTEIKALMESTLGGRQGESYHLITSPMVKLDGDQATTSVMWTVLNRDPEGGKPIVTMMGRHEDVLVREDNTWKFQRRRGFVDIPSHM